MIKIQHGFKMNNERTNDKDKDYKPDIDFLKVKISELEGVVRNQDEVIDYLTKDNAYLKSEQLPLEKIVLSTSKDYLNKVGGPDSAVQWRI